MDRTNFTLPARTKVLIAMSILVLFFLLGLSFLSQASNQTAGQAWWQNFKIWRLATGFNVTKKANKVKEFNLDTEVFSNPKYSSLESAYEPSGQLPLAGNPNPFLTNANPAR